MNPLDLYAVGDDDYSDEEWAEAEKRIRRRRGWPDSYVPDPDEVIYEIEDARLPDPDEARDKEAWP